MTARGIARRGAGWTLWVGALLFAYTSLRYTWDARFWVPFSDEWDFLLWFRDSLEHGLTWGHLWTPHNGHYLPVPRLVFWLRDTLLGGNPTALVLANIALQGGLVAIVVRMIVREPALAGTLLRSVLTAAAIVLLTWTVQLENWHWSIQVVFMLAAFFGVAALRVMMVERPGAALPAAAAATLLAMLASFTLGSGLALFPALLTIAIVRRRGPAACAIVIAGGLFCAAVYLHGSAQASHGIEDAVARPGDIVAFVLRYLGPPFMQDRHKLPLGGLLAFLGAAAVLAGMVRGVGSRLGAFALGLIAFGLTTAVLTALARAGFGEPASSRYAAFSTLFWVGLLCTLALLSLAPRFRALRWGLYAALLYGIFVFPVMATQRAAALPFIARTDDATATAISVLLDMPDRPAIAQHLHPKPDGVVAVAAFLRDRGYGFFGWRVAQAPGRPLAELFGPAQGDCPLPVTTAPVAGGFRLTAPAAPSPPDWLLVTDASGIVRGLAAAQRRQGGGFAGYARAEAAGGTVWGLHSSGALCRAAQPLP